MKQLLNAIRKVSGRGIAVALALLMLAPAAEAKFLEKPEPVRPFEAELLLGFGTAAKFHGGNFVLGYSFGLEMRGNIKETPWDMGGYLRYDAIYYDYSGYMATSNPYMGHYGLDRLYSSLTIGAVSHYNFRQGRKVNPFVGLGVGVSLYSKEGHDFISPFRTDGCTVSFIPKFGVELASWVRFTAYGVIIRKRYNMAGISIGLTIGGWRKNRIPDKTKSVCQNFHSDTPSRCIMP